MLVNGAPQFPTQDDSGLGNGVSTTPRWYLASAKSNTQAASFGDSDIYPAVADILRRLRHIFHGRPLPVLTSTELHDLTCFVLHKLLLLPVLSTNNDKYSAISECLRYAMALYMLIIHGTTYYSHAHLANSMLMQLKEHLGHLAETDYGCGPLQLWILSVGMVSAIGTRDCSWFTKESCSAAAFLGLQTWEDILAQLETVLWTRSEQTDLIMQVWQRALNAPTT